MDRVDASRRRKSGWSLAPTPPAMHAKRTASPFAIPTAKSSPSSKSSRRATRTAATPSTTLPARRWRCSNSEVNLLIVDLSRPAPATRKESTKSSGTTSERNRLSCPRQAADPGGLRRGADLVAYVEPVAVGDPLPEMPVFLAADRYVPCPLETAYQTAWEQFPAPLKGRWRRRRRIPRGIRRRRRRATARAARRLPVWQTATERQEQEPAKPGAGDAPSSLRRAAIFPRFRLWHGSCYTEDNL